MSGDASPGSPGSIFGPNLGGPIEVDVGSLGDAAVGPSSPTVSPTATAQPGNSPFGNVMAGASALANADVAADNASGVEADLDRRGHAADAARKFPENEAMSAAQMQGVGAEGMAQQLPQMLSGLAGAASGALGGVLGPLTQLPQQAFQAGQGAVQAFQGGGAGGLEGAEALAGDADLLGDFEPGEAGLDGAGAGGGGGVGGAGTGPAGVMGPPPVPMSGAPTSPASAPAKPAAVAPEGGARPMAGGMGGGMMPMGAGMGAMGAGAGGAEGNKDKPAEKKIAAPGVAHGQPVKGRVTPPPSMPVAKTAEGKPVTPVTAKRYVIKPDTDDEPPR